MAAWASRHHAEMSIANVEIEGAGAVPAQRLIELEELLDVPTLRKVLGQGGNFASAARAQEALIMEILWAAPLR